VFASKKAVHHGQIIAALLCSDAKAGRQAAQKVAIEVKFWPKILTKNFRIMEKSMEPFLYVVLNRVARWFVFKPNIQIWVNFGGSCNGRWRHILWTFGPFYGLLLYFMDIWYIVAGGNLVYFSRFGILHQEKSGNSGFGSCLFKPRYFVEIMVRAIELITFIRNKSNQY
jgi:hypothetical protein